ncbi:hypothetical protein GGI04_000083 [Coemansia thaxteri]|uniref:DNA-directed RNA polymerase III subunit RPC5 n=1 Tax=Coemansia thaxteri TaxID=2663907 RepID=A0A9W8BMF5_9FUNG|nr:hypothetical protein H4R26_001682 [Coemansia thaxteri]KAJ2009874.1 hypothetical protein GGI04_000083 [Coemansia thaxteri]KAJ2474497.1 hypothetical protein GGI02_000024 [Coemansia sp. RSA 2322]KAJ2485655.1 hypothetical protein EV174_001593 [Coemansia sp. RSA 2320]
MSDDNDAKMGESQAPGISAKDYGLPGDEIVAELPVFLTHRIANNLHLLQYPQKTTQARPGELLPSVARFKPIHGQIEMDIPLDVQSPMYNKERGRELGAGLSDNGRLLDIQTLVSVDVPKSSNYLAAVVREGALHITPIAKVTQLRSSLKYLDLVAEKEQAAKKLEDDDDDEEDAKETKVQTVQVTVRSAQAEEALRQQQSSIAYIQQRQEEEPWSSLSYFDMDSEESNSVFSKLMAAHTEDLVCKTSPDEYLTAIIGSTEPDVL